MTEFQKLEYTRLTGEIQYDRNLQFKVFWQSLAATALLCSNKKIQEFERHLTHFDTVITFEEISSLFPTIYSEELLAA